MSTLWIISVYYSQVGAGKYPSPLCQPATYTVQRLPGHTFTCVWVHNLPTHRVDRGKMAGRTCSNPQRQNKSISGAAHHTSWWVLHPHILGALHPGGPQQREQAEG